MTTPSLVPEPGTLANEVRELWDVFGDGRTRTLEWRRHQIDGVERFLRDREEEIAEALRVDLGKPAFEAYASDVGGVLSELALIRKTLRRSMQPTRLRTPLRSRPAKSLLYPEPWGAVLILPAWNYPIGLALLPLLGAVAGGNTVAIKPAEMAPASSALLAERLGEYVDTQAIRVFEGGADVAADLLKQRFGHIHFTGSARVGRIVMQAAAAHLTPVTLELGGKNPAYVHADTDVEIAARRIFWGRLFNAGQTCISPDYVLVDRRIEPELIEAMIGWARSAYGPDPRHSPDFARLVNDQQYRRVVALLDGAGEVVYGGEHDASDRYVAPTLVRGVSEDHPIMHEEIFGPILPVVAVDGPDDAIARIRARPQPLTMYVFAADEEVSERIIRQTSAGSVVVNQMFTQAFNPVLPFGGVGESGMGSYTGLHSFSCFTHMKPVAKSPIRPDVPVLYPPYRPWKRAVVRRLLR